MSLKRPLFNLYNNELGYIEGQKEESGRNTRGRDTSLRISCIVLTLRNM